MAASFASAPLLQKNARSRPERATSRRAASTCSGIWFWFERWMLRAACFERAATSAGWAWPRDESALPPMLSFADHCLDFVLVVLVDWAGPADRSIFLWGCIPTQSRDVEGRMDAEGRRQVECVVVAVGIDMGYVVWPDEWGAIRGRQVRNLRDSRSMQ